MQSCCLDFEEDMKDADRKWVQTEIKTAIQEHLDPRGWRKLQAYLPLVGILAIFLTLLGLTAAGWNYAFTTMAQETAFQAHTTDALKLITDRLTRIEGELGILQAQNAARKFSAIPVQELKGHRDELASVKKKLASLPQDTPNFWSASFQIITLLSQAQAAAVMEKVSQKPVETVDNGHFLRIPGIITRAIHDQNILLKNSISGLEFYDSVIHFDPSVRLANVAFINCVFIFPAQERPTKPLQQIGTTLLASDLAKVTLNAS